MKKSDLLIARYLAIPVVKFYKLVLSPVAYMLGSRCRFYPSCSTYALEAFKLHGMAKGLWLTVFRVAKCNPLHPGGFDPVPSPKTGNKNCLC